MHRTRACLLGDVEAYLAGEPAPERAEGDLQEQILDSFDIAERLNIAKDSLSAIMHDSPHRVPPPAGRVGKIRSWPLISISPGWHDRSPLAGRCLVT